MHGKRSQVLFGLVVLLLIVILGRLTQMQLLWGQRFQQDYRAGPAGNEILDTVRGSIISADGRVLAKDIVSRNIAVHYSLLQSGDREEWVEVVAGLTEESPDRLHARAEAICRRVERIWEVVRESTQMEHLRIVEQDQYHPVVMDVSREVAVHIHSLRDRFDGIKIQERSIREYAGGNLFPHILGQCGRLSADRWKELFDNDRTWFPGIPVRDIGTRYRMDDTLGVSGIERQFEDILRGRRGYIAHSIEFRPFRVERISETRAPEPGGDLHLTLRADFQEAVMQVFARAARDPDSGFQRGAAVIMDAGSGAVLAAGTWPSYTQEEFRTDYASILRQPHSPLLFRPAQAALPTGSVYKLMTAIAALEEEKIHRGTAFHCEGRKRIHGRWFGCLGYHGRIGLEEAIERSCNVYFYEIALKLGGRQLSRWGREFGFGRRSGLDWPAEVPGSLDAPDSVFARINLSIGQGDFLATPLQVAAMAAAIANGGRPVNPHFVAYAVHPEGSIIYRHTPEERRISLRDGTLETVRNGMRRAVHGGGGTARDAGLRPFRAAGKTGTAELGAGLPNHAWFAGYAPYDDPRIAFAIVSERTDGQGGGHAAPLMGRILEEIWPGVNDGL